MMICDEADDKIPTVGHQEDDDTGWRYRMSRSISSRRCRDLRCTSGWIAEATGWIPHHGVGRDTLVGMITLLDVNRTSPIDREAMQVRDIMTRDPITLPPAALVIDSLRIMSAHDIERIPIVQDDKIVGIVTRMDILKVTELRQI
jgi:CBS domain-containing protein